MLNSWWKKVPFVSWLKKRHAALYISALRTFNYRLQLAGYKENQLSGLHFMQVVTMLYYPESHSHQPQQQQNIIPSSIIYVNFRLMSCLTS